MLALAYLSVFSEIVPADFTLWLWAATGSLKSTLASLVLSHFGDFSEDHLPVEFAATANYIERVLFLLKDVLVVVDDWRPAVSRSDAAEQDRKAQRLLRAVGNRAGRGRMRSDTSLRPTYTPRGAVMVTAESIPEGPAFESATARALTVNLMRDDVDLPLLSELQRTKDELGVAMHGYISWAAENYESYKTLLPEKRREYRERLAPSLAGSHPRTPTMAAALMVGFRMFATFATATGAITTEERNRLLARGEAAIVEACKLHTENTAGEDPATRFLDILRSLFSAGRAYAKDAEYGCHPDDWAELGWERRETQDGEDIVPERKATFIGWVDDEFVYLDKDPAYAAVSEFVQRGGIPFGVKPRTLWQSLKRAGLTLCSTNRTDTTKRIEGKTRRVIQLRRSAILGGEDDG